MIFSCNVFIRISHGSPLFDTLIQLILIQTNTQLEKFRRIHLISRKWTLAYSNTKSKVSDQNHLTV